LTKRLRWGVKIMYQLSQSAQKDAWRDIGETSSYDHAAVAGRARLQTRWLSNYKIIPDYWDEAAELVWIDPRGVPIVFVGGRDAFKWDAQKSIWTYTNGPVPGLWRLDSEYAGFGYIHYSVNQRQESPLRVDRYDISAEDLIEMEELRRYDIKQSKIKTDKEDAARRAKEAEADKT